MAVVLFTLPVIGAVSLGTAVSVGLTVAAMLLNRPHQQTPTFKSMTSAWGNTWPIAYNHFRLAGQCIQAGPVTEHDSKTKKGGATFSQTFAMGICEGVHQLGRIWADDVVIYDPRPITAPPPWEANTTYGAGDVVLPTAGGLNQFTATTNGESGPTEPSWVFSADALTYDNTITWIESEYVPRQFVGQQFPFVMRIYNGTEDQLADSALEELVGTGKQPAYRGLMYVVFENFNLAPFGNRIPNLEFELLAAVPISGILDTGHVGVFINTPTNAMFVIGEDGNHYIIDSERGFSVNSDSAPLHVAQAEDKSVLTIDATQWRADFASTNLPAGIAGTFSPVASPLPCPGTPYFYWLGYQQYGLNGSTLPSGLFYACGVRYKINSAGTPVVDGGFLYKGTNTPVELYGIPYPGWCYGAMVKNGFVYAANYTGNANAVIYGIALLRLPLSGTILDISTAAWNDSFTFLTTDLYPQNSTGGSGTQFYFENAGFLAHNNASILPLSNGSFRVFSYLSKFTIDNIFPNPPNPIWHHITTAGSEFWDVDPFGHIASTTPQDYQSDFGQPWADSATLYSGAPSALARDDYTAPNVEAAPGGYLITFCRLFTDNIDTIRFRQYFYDSFADSISFMGTFERTVEGPVPFAQDFAMYYNGIYAMSNSDHWYFPNATETEVTLATICADISRRVGLSASNYDYSGLSSVTPRGVALLQRQTARNFLEGMQPAYFYDLTDIGTEIVGTLRSDSSLLLTIPESDLAADTDPTVIKDKLSTERDYDLEIPRDLSMTYYDVDHDYQQGSQPSKRDAVTNFSSGKNTVTVPVVMKPGEAATAAARALYLLWIERNIQKFSVPLPYFKITPTDVIAVNRGNRTHQIRVTKTNLQPDSMLIDMEGVSEDFGFYTALVATPSLSDLTGGSFTPGTIVPIVEPVLAVMDTATLRSTELYESGTYAAASRSDPDGAWAGVTVSESPDNSVFTSVGTLPNEATIGLAVTTLGDAPRWTVWDRTNSIDVQLYDGALGSASEASLVANATVNLAWLSTGEIIQFATATLLDTNKYRLTNLLRGRFGTESYRRAHVIGETFVLLQTSTAGDMPYSISDVGATRYWEATNLGGNSPTQTLTMTTRRLLPYAPFYIAGARDGGLNLTVTGKRRMRWRGKPLWTPPETDTPVAMQIDILSNASPPTVLRTLTSTLSGAGSGIIDPASFQAYYAAADQVTDFGSAQSSLNIIAYETNAMVGRGYGRAATV